MMIIITCRIYGSPSVALSSMMQPLSPKVTITNCTLGNLRSIDRSALGIDGAPVHS